MRKPSPSGSPAAGAPGRATPLTPRPVGKTDSSVVVERFMHAGLEVEVTVVGSELSPRNPEEGPGGVIVCAAPHHSLTDVRENGQRVLADDAALALLLAAPLSERGLSALESHVRAQYEAMVVVPLYLDEQDLTARTGLSLSVAPGAGVLVGVIFDGPDENNDDDDDDDDAFESNSGSGGRGPHEEQICVVRDDLVNDVARYRDYLRGDILMATVYSRSGELIWSSIMTYDGDIEGLRADVKLAAERDAPEAREAARQRQAWIDEDPRG